MKQLILCAGLLLVASFATAAYNPKWAMDALYASRVSNCDGSLMAKWECGSSCDYFSTGMQGVKVFSNVTQDTRAWIGYDASEDRVMLTIRGSRNVKNWLEDFEFWKMQYPGAPDGVKVHYGFYHVVTGLNDLGMMKEFVALIQAHPGAAVLVNGHSLGASAAELAMLELMMTQKGNPQTNLENRTVELYTFGSPRTGNQKFVAYIGGMLPNMRQHRLTHHHDPIPHLPPRWASYLHIPQEVYLPTNHSTPYKICNGTFTHEDPTCIDSQKGNDPYDHIWYLGKCMGCCGPAPYNNCCSHLPLPNFTMSEPLPDGDFFVLP